MSHQQFPTDGPPPSPEQAASSPEADKTAPAGAGQHYSELQSAARFPIKLPISLKSESGESQTLTENISANGVMFQLDSDVPIGSPVDFTISLPAGILGAEVDVQLDCHGRVVRTFDDGSRKGVGVVIDEYYFDRRQ